MKACMLRILTLVLIAPCLLLSSCGSKKSTSAYPDYTGRGTVPTRVEEVTDECKEMALNAPASELRASGSAISSNRDFGTHQAVLYAKAALVAQIESLTLNVMKAYRSDTRSNGKMTNEEVVKQDVGAMSEQTIENCKVICSKVYRLSDGTYECNVCVSIPARDVEQAIGATVLTDDERLKVEFNAEQFRNSYADELKAFREKQMNNR